MANFVYNHVAGKGLDGTLILGTAILKVMLVDNSYTPDRDDVFISSGAGTVGDAEISVTNYTGGFGGAGRKTITGQSVSVDNVNDRAELDVNDIMWTALGGAVNDTIQALIVVEEKTSDADSLLVAYIDTSTGSPSLPFLTSGGDFTAVVNANGIIQMSTV
ncbi:MAG: hypothetical protein ACR2N7_05380 [Acidimicrobiia bacterium]